MERLHKFLNTQLCAGCDIKWATLKSDINEDIRVEEAKLLKHYSQLMDDQGRIMIDCATCEEPFDWLEEHGGLYYYHKSHKYSCDSCTSKYADE